MMLRLFGVILVIVGWFALAVLLLMFSLCCGFSCYNVFVVWGSVFGWVFGLSLLSVNALVGLLGLSLVFVLICA